MAAQFPGDNNHGGGSEISSWMAQFTGAVMAMLREERLAPPPPAADSGWKWPNHQQNVSGEFNKKCELCNVFCTSSVMVAEHERGKRHQKNLLKSQKPDSAAANNNEESAVQQTADSEKMKKKGKRAIEADDEEMEPSKKQKKFEENKDGQEFPFKCFMCKIKCIHREGYDRHLSGKKHKLMVQSHWAQGRSSLGLQALYLPNTSGT